MTAAPLHPTVFDLGPVREVLPGRRAEVTLGGEPVLLLRTRRGIFAVRNRCPHRDLPLSEATVRGRFVRCAWHGREYDLRSGACRTAPGSAGLVRYRAWVESGHLLVALSG